MEVGGKRTSGHGESSATSYGEIKMDQCGVCGGTLRPAVHNAREDGGRKLVGVPGIECQTCGAIRPDEEKIASMPQLRIPSSIRLRCVKVPETG